MIYKSYEFQIYPTKQQKVQLEKTFYCVRYVYNYYIDKTNKEKESKNLKFNFQECCDDLDELKKEKKFLNEVDPISLTMTLRFLNFAYRNYYRGIKNHPKFKSSKYHSYRYSTKNFNDSIKINENYIEIPNIGPIRYKPKHAIEGTIFQATVKHEPDNRYYITLLYYCEKPNQLNKSQKAIGIDVGLKHFAVISNGQKIANPKYFDQNMKKLAKANRLLSRRVEGSSNWEKQRIKVGRIQKHITKQRKDFINKLTTQLINDYDIICVETLDILNMVKKGNWARQIEDASWREFIRQLEYKADWYGKKVIKVNHHYPSSQICSNCRCKNNEIKKLSIRKWICPHCGKELDRDINAAINILNEGLRQLNKN